MRISKGVRSLRLSRSSADVVVGFADRCMVWMIGNVLAEAMRAMRRDGGQ